jgi:hypothetical protein
VSYVRWSSPGHPHSYDSEIYIYDDVSGGTTCCGCSLNDDGRWNGDRNPDYRDHRDDDENEPNVAGHPETIAHVREHIAAGHAVPDFVIPRLQKDQGFS